MIFDRETSIILEEYRSEVRGLYDWILFETEFLYDLSTSGRASVAEIVLNPQRTILLELSDSSRGNSMPDPELLTLVYECACLIKREPDIKNLCERGFPRSKIIPSLFGWQPVKAFKTTSQVNTVPFFFGTLTHPIRFHWLDQLYQYYNQPESLVLYHQSYEPIPEIQEPSMMENSHEFYKTEDERLSREDYESLIETLFFGICLRGIGELTARHVENWESGRLVFSDTSISHLDNFLVRPIHMQNCVLAESCDELLDMLQYFVLNQNEAGRIAKNGQKMVHEIMQPSRLAAFLFSYLRL